MVRDMNLESGDTGQGARRRPDLGRVVGEGREIVAYKGTLVSEPVTGDLHAVAGVAGETDHHLVDRFDPSRFANGLGLCRHGSSTRLAGLLPATVTITLTRLPVVVGILPMRPPHHGDIRPRARARVASQTGHRGDAEVSGDRHRIVQVNVLDGLDDADSLAQGALKRLASHDETHAAGALVDDRSPDRL